MEKIPSELRLVVSRKFGSEESWNLDALLSALKTELEARERCIAMKTSGPNVNTTKFEQYRARNKQPYSASALYTGSEEFTQHCVFCKKNHKSINCMTVTEPKARRTILRRNGKCFMCPKGGHISTNCPSRAKCFNCEGRHHVTICERIRNTLTSRNVVREEASPRGSGSCQDGSRDAGTSAMHISNNANSVLLQIAQAFVCRPDNEQLGLNAHVIFDSCSQRSYITSQAREKLNLPTIGKETLLIKTFGDNSASVKECDVVQLCVRTLDGMNVYITSYVVPVICSPVSNQQSQGTLECYPYLQGLQLACDTSDSVNVDVLIGADYYWSFFTGNIIKGDPYGPVALETNLGWVLSGPSVCSRFTRSCTVNLSSTHVLKIESTHMSDMKDDLQKFWDLETLGIKEHETSVYDKFSNDITFTGERYQVKLPFKDNHPMLPDNYTVALRRLTTTIKKLKNQPEILKQYDDVIREQLQSGVVEKVPQDQIPQPGDVHYLPHRTVVRLDRDTTKVRVVYDASSKVFGPSLNDCLHIGPSLNPLLFDILLRFRVHEVALTADVEKAFLNIEIDPEHRDFVRFLWVKDLNKENLEVMELRFARVVFGVNSSPFILNATIRHHLNTCLPVDSALARELLKSLYVDDYVSGKGDVGSAFTLSKEIKLCLKSGGFNMRKWSSNSESLLRSLEQDETFSDDFEKSNRPKVAEEDESFSKSVFKHSSEKEQRVLGMLWNPTQDELIYDLNKTLGEVDAQPVTKRLILSTATRFFDPLGLIAPVILPLKMMFQKLCKDGKDWDELVDAELNHKWLTTLSDLRQTGRVSFRRCYAEGLNGDKVKSVQLHCFADASERAYGAVVYMRVEYEAKVKCQIVSSKTRVAPLAKQTIPRLELLSNLTASRLLKSVSQALHDDVRIDEVFNWTDSMISLWWITNTDKEYKQFVENRVAEIRRNSPPEQWRYCPTADNPADIASRGIRSIELKESSLWLLGPDFLSKSGEQWPAQPTVVQAREEFSELKSSKPAVYSLVTACVEEKKEEPSLDNLINPENFSSLTKLMKLTVLVLSFIEKLKKTRSREGAEVDFTKLYRQAEMLWIRHVQQEILKSDKYPQRRSSLGLYQDEEGILRCQGRIGMSSLPFDTRFPMLLPRSHYFTKLVILKCHDQVMHNGVAETLVQLRSRYWIVKGRQTVKSIINKCVVCKKLEGRPYGTPPASQLPRFRLSDEFAFTSIGVDFAGPVYVKDIYHKSADMNKAYIVLYTCASSRAVHLDLVPRLTTEIFVRSFKRFIARRGVPNLVVSDNGSTFKGEALKKLLAEHRIEWKFNVALAPWWGGFFERLVRSTKRCLKKTLGTARVSYEELLSVVVEIEGILNSRPLTYVDDELRSPLTPSQLIIGRRLLSKEDKTPSKTPPTRSELSRRAKYLTIVLSQFWRRWQKEYLTELRVHHNCQLKNRQPTVNVGDVVCIHKDGTPRLLWNMGVVKSLITGRDGVHRGAVVRTRSGDRVIEVTRPLKRLYPVEAGPGVQERQNRNTDFPITFVGNAEHEHVAER